MNLTVENIRYPHLFIKTFKNLINSGVTLLCFYLHLVLSIENVQPIYCPPGKGIYIYKAEGNYSWYYF